MNNNVILKVENVEFSYPSFDVLKGLSFQVEKGQIVAILGPNGAGKSTLLKCLNYKLKAKGTVLVGKNLLIKNLNRREIAKIFGFIPQESEIKFNFTGLEIVLMGRYPYLKKFNWPDENDLKIAYEIMEKTNTIYLANRPFHQMSGGEKQKIIIARTLCQNPKILLCDEPLLHLDLKNQIEILKLLKSLSIKEKLTIIFVCHDLNIASQFAEKFILLSEGKIYAIGDNEILNEENIKNVFGVKTKIIFENGIKLFHYVI